jgi:hypothetical protein
MNFKGFDEFVESKIFKDIIKKEAVNLNIAFAFFYGSRNYNLETDKSDYDFFISYYPLFENFYTHTFARFSLIEKDYDYFIAPFHEYIGHAMNGNIKFIEPFICGTIFQISGYDNYKDLKVERVKNSEFIEKVKKFILANFRKNFDSMAGIIRNKRLNVEKGLYTSTTMKYKESHGYDIKEAINSLRIIFMLKNYIHTGELSFKVKQNPVYEEFENYLYGINEKKICKKHYIEIINKKMEDIGGDKSLQEVKLKDEKAKSSRLEIKKEIEDYVMKTCKNNACSA